MAHGKYRVEKFTIGQVLRFNRMVPSMLVGVDQCWIDHTSQVADFDPWEFSTRKVEFIHPLGYEGIHALRCLSELTG